MRIATSPAIEIDGDEALLIRMPKTRAPSQAILGPDGAYDYVVSGRDPGLRTGHT